MAVLEKFETGFLFGLTRFVAMFIIFCLISAIIVGAVVASGTLSGKVSTKVTTDEVIEAIRPPVAGDAINSANGVPTQSSPVDANLLPGIKLPFALQKEFNTPSNIRVLRDWLNAIPEDHRQKFLDEMAAAAVEAGKQNLSVPDAINAYKALKFNKLDQKKIAQAALEQTRLYYVAGAVSCIALTAMFSLILVLLAIERNTRKAQA
jgi:hypothetical protein